MTTKATQSGAAATEEKPALQYAHEARGKLIQEIAQRRHAERAGEFSEFNEETGEVGGPAFQQEQPQQEETPADAPAQEQAGEGEQEQQQAAQEEKPEPQQTDEYETLIVHGQEIKVEKSKIFEAGKRTLQKETAADRRLEEATRMRREAETLLQRVQRVAQGAALPNEQQPSGHEPAAAEPSPTTLDPGALMEQVAHQTALMLYNRDAEKAAKKFVEEFQDIASDPILAAYVVQLEDQRIREATELGNPLGDPFEAYRKHGLAIREWQKKHGLLRQPESTQQKVERKKETVQNVPSASLKAPAPTPPKPPTRGEIIEQMRKARGQRN